MKRILLFLVTILSLSLVIGVDPSPTYAADPLKKACDNANYTDDQRSKLQEASACGNDGSSNPISGGADSLLGRITTIVATVAGVIAVIIVIIGGISMMTAAGDSQKFANGRNTLIFAAVGLIIVVLARALITFVLNSTTT